MDKTNVDYLLKKLEKALTEFPHHIGDGDINLNLQITIIPSKKPEWHDLEINRP